MKARRDIWSIIVEKCGVVSLLDILDFAARSYLEIANKFGLCLGQGQPCDPDVVRDLWSTLLVETGRLNLPVTREHLICFFEEAVKENPGLIKFNAEGFEFIGAKMGNDRMRHHVESIYNSLRAELGSFKLKVIPQEKSKYCDAEWLTNTSLFTKFPSTVDEFQKAGRCFAYGENTACVFHLMRVTDFCLRKLAESLGIEYRSSNWKGIGDDISAKMEQRYQTKSGDWKSKEPFYASILTDIQAIGRGHRNPTLHEIEVKYDEREALYILAVIESFALHVAERL